VTVPFSGVRRAEQKNADRGAAGVVEGAGLRGGAARHGDAGEVAQHVVGVGGGDGAVAYKGYWKISKLVSALANYQIKKGLAVKAKKA
jgi:hypothetical protein